MVVNITRVSQEKNLFHIREVCCLSPVTCKVLISFLKEIMHCLTADYITSLNFQQQHLTSPCAIPKHK